MPRGAGLPNIPFGKGVVCTHTLPDGPGASNGKHGEKAGEVAKIIGRVAIGLVVAASAIALAPCANADDNSFLANLAQHGIFTARDPAVLVALGQAICTDLAKGVSTRDEVNRFEAKELPTSPTPQASQAFVDAAHQELCPDAPG